jgi:hypothetical protein
MTQELLSPGLTATPIGWGRADPAWRVVVYIFRRNPLQSAAFHCGKPSANCAPFSANVSRQFARRDLGESGTTGPGPGSLSPHRKLSKNRRVSAANTSRYHAFMGMQAKCGFFSRGVARRRKAGGGGGSAAKAGQPRFQLGTEALYLLTSL